MQSSLYFLSAYFPSKRLSMSLNRHSHWMLLFLSSSLLLFLNYQFVTEFLFSLSINYNWELSTENLLPTLNVILIVRILRRGHSEKDGISKRNIWYLSCNVNKNHLNSIYQQLLVCLHSLISPLCYITDSLIYNNYKGGECGQYPSCRYSLWL